MSSFKMGEGFEFLKDEIALNLEDFSHRLLETAVENAPVSTPYQRKGKRGRGKTGFRVIVEIGENGKPQIAKGVGSPTNPAASRAIKTKSIDELTPLKGNVGLFTYTFERHEPGTLKKSGKVIEATIEGNTIRTGIVFTAPYTIFVEKGTKKQPAQGFMIRALDAHAGEIENGSAIKG